MNKNLKDISIIFGLIFLAQAISLVGFLHPIVRQIAFVAICLSALIFTIKDLRWGILILFTELFIGSKGYLFYFDYHEKLISIRIAIWGIVMAVWLVESIVNCQLSIVKSYNRLFSCFFVFLLFLAGGVINAFFHHNALDNIYSDFNNWLYFLTFLPLITVIRTKEDWQKILEIFIASTLWLSLESLALFFIFSHDLPQTAGILYSWIRNTLIGEITFVQMGFFRIFIQSQIFNLLGFFMILPLLLESQKSKKERAFYFLLSTFYLTVVIVSLSRSFWLGLAGGLLFAGGYFLFKKEWRKFLKLIGIFLGTAIFSFLIVIAVLKFPYPAPLSGDSLEMFKNRATQLGGEAAISSRWNLLPVIWQEIERAPIIGYGWGKTITYKSMDPRVLQKNPNGEYTTFAFEWGWLDLWLKIGFLGLLSFIIFISVLAINLGRNIKNNFLKIPSLGLIAALVSSCVVHFFTPYLNHPLGIGFILLVLSATLYSNVDINN
jgi:O-antigen ligase